MLDDTNAMGQRSAMVSDAAYSSMLDQTIASLKAWTGFVADVARVEDDSDESAWRLSLTPQSPRACPIAIVLRLDRSYDLRIAGETYEGRPIASLDLFLPLIDAIAEGRVLTRRVFSATTGLPHGVSTVVTLADGRVLEEKHHCQPGFVKTDSATEIRDTHYLPYRRASGFG